VAFTSTDDGLASVDVEGPQDVFVRDLDIWVGRFDVSLVFANGFESGDSNIWTMPTP
jgi:hypothetical protein